MPGNYYIVKAKTNCVLIFQGGDPESGEEVITTGGPDAGAFCVFPFIWKSKVFRSCARVRKTLLCWKVIFPRIS